MKRFIIYIIISTITTLFSCIYLFDWGATIPFINSIDNALNSFGNSIASSIGFLSKFSPKLVMLIFFAICFLVFSIVYFVIFRLVAGPISKRYGTGGFFAKNIFRYVFPYLLFGEILYLALSGVRTKTIFIFRGFLTGISDTSTTVGLWIDIGLMIIGLAAIIYSGVRFANDDGFTGYTNASETYQVTTVHESWTGKMKGRKENVTVYDEDNIFLNVMIFIWNFIKIFFISLFGYFIFIVSTIKFLKLPKKEKNEEE